MHRFKRDRSHSRASVPLCLLDDGVADTLVQFTRSQAPDVIGGRFEVGVVRTSDNGEVNDLCARTFFIAQ